MNITELFEEIQKKFKFNELKGDITINNNSILWSYSFENDSNEIDHFFDIEDDGADFSFNALTSEEILYEAHEEDLNKIEMFLDKIDELDNWTIDDPYIGGDTISFKIY